MITFKNEDGSEERKELEFSEGDRVQVHAKVEWTGTVLSAEFKWGEIVFNVERDTPLLSGLTSLPIQGRGLTLIEAVPVTEVSEAENALGEVLKHILVENQDMEATFETEIDAGYYPEIDPRPSLHENGVRYVEKPGLLADLYGADADSADLRVVFSAIWSDWLQNYNFRDGWSDPAREEELFRAFQSGVESVKVGS